MSNEPEETTTPAPVEPKPTDALRDRYASVVGEVNAATQAQFGIQKAIGNMRALADKIAAASASKEGEARGLTAGLKVMGYDPTKDPQFAALVAASSVKASEDFKFLATQLKALAMDPEALHAILGGKSVAPTPGAGMTDGKGGAVATEGRSGASVADMEGEVEREARRVAQTEDGTVPVGAEGGVAPTVTKDMSAKPSEAARRAMAAVANADDNQGRAGAMVDPDTGRAIPAKEMFTIDEDAPDQGGASREGGDAAPGVLPNA